ncbi:hypothetical protein BURMUCGD1_1185 [Burkholderia multivorans CGD1]|nr:hypothetical protein BURMUCGD1_1185 [Burkholderia multivorans CGD1]
MVAHVRRPIRRTSRGTEIDVNATIFTRRAYAAQTGLAQS